MVYPLKVSCPSQKDCLTKPHFLPFRLLKDTNRFDFRSSVSCITFNAYCQALKLDCDTEIFK